MPTDVNSFSLVTDTINFTKGWPEDSVFFENLPSFFHGETMHGRENYDEEAPLLLNNGNHDHSNNLNVESFLINNGSFAQMQQVREQELR